MSLFSSCHYAALAGTGLGLFSLGATRRPDIGLKPLGIAVLAFACMAAPARADQFIEAADNAQIDCLLSRGELTRIALVDDGFANVSKIASGYPYNDVSITHEPVRGDIYISVPVQFASNKVSFFATSKAGYVWHIIFSRILRFPKQGSNIHLRWAFDWVSFPILLDETQRSKPP